MIVDAQKTTKGEVKRLHASQRDIIVLVRTGQCVLRNVPVCTWDTPHAEFFSITVSHVLPMLGAVAFLLSVTNFSQEVSLMLSKIQAVADATNMSVTWLRRQLKDDPNFPHLRCGRSYRFVISDVIDYLRKSGGKSNDTHK
jgi:hypothetical protein